MFAHILTWFWQLRTVMNRHVNDVSRQKVFASIKPPLTLTPWRRQDQLFIAVAQEKRSKFVFSLIMTPCEYKVSPTPVRVNNQTCFNYLTTHVTNLWRWCRTLLLLARMAKQLAVQIFHWHNSLTVKARITKSAVHVAWCERELIYGNDVSGN